MGTDIASGASGPTPAPVQPLDAALLPGVQRPGMIQPGQLSGPTIPGRDVVGEYREQMDAAQAECEAAMRPGMGAEDDRRAHYQAQALPLGSHIGDDMVLPPVPDNAVPPAMSDEYPDAGLEPTPAAAGMAGPYGGEPG